MLIHLHKQATTTPKVRAAIQASGEPASVLVRAVRQFGGSENDPVNRFPDKRTNDLQVAASR